MPRANFVAAAARLVSRESSVDFPTMAFRVLSATQTPAGLGSISDLTQNCACPPQCAQKRRDSGARVAAPSWAELSRPYGRDLRLIFSFANAKFSFHTGSKGRALIQTELTYEMTCKLLRPGQAVEKTSQQIGELFRLLQRGVMAGVGDYLQAAATNVLPHKLRLG